MDLKTCKNLKMLGNTARVKKWGLHLRSLQFKPPTIKSYISNVRAFMSYCEKSGRHTSLTAAAFKRINYTLTTMAKQVGGELVGHRQKVKKAKSSLLISTETMLRFIKHAVKRIPELLQLIKDEWEIDQYVEEFQGCLALYIALISGHRSGVITYLSKEDFKNAQKVAEGYTIDVDNHKTSAAFGGPRVCLTPKEYGWVTSYFKQRLAGSEQFLFHLDTGEPRERLSNVMQGAWAGAGLTGRPTFNIIRSSVSTQVGKNLTTEEAGRVSTMMCYDALTAKAVYRTPPSHDEAWKVRVIRMKALVEDIDTSSEEEESSEEDTGEEKDKWGCSNFRRWGGISREGSR